MHKSNVLIVASRKLAREGLSLLLQNLPDIQVAGETGEPKLVPKLVDSLRVDVVLLFWPLPGWSERATFEQTLADRPKLKAIVLATQLSTSTLHDLLGVGVAGCLTKDCCSKELIDAIRAVVGGQTYLSPELTSILANERRHNARNRTPVLARREREILQLIASGRTTKAIALELGVSTKTVETYRRRLMEKLNRHSVAELTQYAMLEQLV